jgi:hypothetical protein
MNLLKCCGHLICGDNTDSNSNLQLLNPEPQLVDPEPQLVDPEPQLVDPEPQLVDPEPQLVDPEPQLLQLCSANCTCIQFVVWLYNEHT